MLKIEVVNKKHFFYLSIQKKVVPLLLNKTFKLFNQ